MGKVNRSFGMEERIAGLFNEYTPGISEFYDPSLFSNKKVKPMLFFKFGDLFA